MTIQLANQILYTMDHTKSCKITFIWRTLTLTLRCDEIPDCGWGLRYCILNAGRYYMSCLVSVAMIRELVDLH